MPPRWVQLDLYGPYMYLKFAPSVHCAKSAPDLWFANMLLNVISSLLGCAYQIVLCPWFQPAWGHVLHQCRMKFLN